MEKGSTPPPESETTTGGERYVPLQPFNESGDALTDVIGPPSPAQDPETSGYNPQGSPAPEGTDDKLSGANVELRNRLMTIL